MTEKEQRKAAKEFAERWKDKGYEKGESQPFWLSLLNEVYGVQYPSEYIRFEDKVVIDRTSFIDGIIDETHVLIEQKSRGKDLRKGIKQSDGSFLSPFDQANRYANSLPYDDKPRWIIISNFEEILVYDMNKPHGEPEQILLKNLEKDYYRLDFLIRKDNIHLNKELEVSIKAGEIVGILYDAISRQYIDITQEESFKSLNMLCVRLVFCLYAEDAGLFGRKSMFHDYLIKFDSSHLRTAIIELFKVLNTKIEDRDPYLEESLSEFPFVNGGLFADISIEIPQLNDEIKDLLLNKASEGFDWSEISPTIFGSVFESTLNPETRRSGGMHYTSIENIHKVIDPLFLDELHEELDEIRKLKNPNTIENRVKEYQEKLASLTFLDPAAGSGNFLTESYLSIRRLENESISLTVKAKQIQLGFKEHGFNPIKVSIKQFYGIEINDFAVSVARTALWIAESQMIQKTEKIIHTNIDLLPLKTYPNIIEGNSLSINWNEVINKNNLSYIIGNPPFVGHSIQNSEQKKQMRRIYTDEKGNEYRLSGKIDYVAGWFFKAAEFIENTAINASFVSTNSITQGEQVEGVWKPLYERFSIIINFAYKTFKWRSEASDQAAVHVVIIGFSHISSENKRKKLFSNNNHFSYVSNINPYLVEAPTVFVSSRQFPISPVSTMYYGSKPTDGGHFFFTQLERDELLKKEPQSEKFIHRVYGSKEFINNQVRYVLWLENASPEELRKSSIILDRINKVKDFRLSSNAQSTRDYAKFPTLFKQRAQPNTNYLLIPRVSSESRKYIPIGFMSKDDIATDAVQIVPNATIYEFGVLTSNVHMGWMRAVGGRLKSDYRYSAQIVYNNFPWPKISKDDQKTVEETAQKILEAREMYPNSSYADLYDNRIMPSKLRIAHQNNDRAVMKAYGFNIKMTESECVAELMKMYQKLVKE